VTTPSTISRRPPSKTLLVYDEYTPDFTLTGHEFRTDVTDEVVGDGYFEGGVDNSGQSVEWTTPDEVVVYHLDPVTYGPVTNLTDVMGAVTYYDNGADHLDRLIFLHDFVTAASTSNGYFTIWYSTGGAVEITFTGP